MGNGERGINLIGVEEEIDASEWNVGKPNRDSTMSSWDDTYRLSVWWQAYPSKKKKKDYT